MFDKRLYCLQYFFKLLAVKTSSIFLIALLVFTVNAFGQKRSDKNPVTYEELYDEPYAINKLFVHFQPLYGELWTANVNAGFGLEATYFWDDKMQFRAHTRKAYTRNFDLSRDIAENMKEDNPLVGGESEVFNYYEFGATYHIKDFEESSETKMFLYKKSYKGDKWAGRVPLNAEIPCKVRKIYGARLGGMFYDTSFEVNRAVESQDKTMQEVFPGIPATYVGPEGETEETRLFTNMSAAGLYVGGSITWIRNIAVDFDNNYQEGVDDLILTAFLDILIAPSASFDDVVYDGMAYPADGLDTSAIGFRAGLEGKFNRTWGWAYGGEIGMRPGLAGRGFYTAIKISFPVFSTNLDYSVEAFGK